MRRGHPSIGGGWRGDNPRHFRPRGGGIPHFRPPMGFGPMDAPRFPGPVQRHRGPRPFNSHPNNSDVIGPSERERQYRGPGHPSNQSRLQDRGQHDNRERNMLPFLQKRLHDNKCGGFTNKSFFEGHKYNTNNMGDVDHRLQDVDLRRPYGQHTISPWAIPPFERRQYHNDNGPPKHNIGEVLLPNPDYSGHRPPSSDHYSDTSSTNNNNNPYTRSVDDTVDIVRKKLMNRDSLEHSHSTDHRDMDTGRSSVDETYHNTTQEQPVKKRVQRQRQINSNCDQMKNKIVHQLFKMDKTKIHKLMDNPNSSTKFEYAISSLITESQNSFNRHMRSVAEKSLTTSSSTDIIHDNNNTIYEDTFMRQMQGVLDPQDTVLLEDIKPLVLAELSKVLGLDNLSSIEGVDEYGGVPKDDYSTTYYNEFGDDYPQHSDYQHEQEIGATEVITEDLYEDRKYTLEIPQQTSSSSPLYERRVYKPPEIREKRSRSKSTESGHPRRSIDSTKTQQPQISTGISDSEQPPRNIDNTESRQSHRSINDTDSQKPPRSIDNSEKPSRSFENMENRQLRISFDNTEIQQPRISFDNAESRQPRISFDSPESRPPRRSIDNNSIQNTSNDESKEPEESRPLFDGSYDHLSEGEDPFAELDNQYHVAVDHDFIEREDGGIVLPMRDPSPMPVKKEMAMPINETSNDIMKEIDNQLLHISKSPTKLLSKLTQKTNKSLKIKQEIQVNVEAIKESFLPKTLSVQIKQEPLLNNYQKQEPPTPTKEPVHEPIKHPMDSAKLNSRKRSIDTKPPHRKEKRKKSTYSPEPSIFNMFFDKTPAKDSKTDASDKSYSDKYVKRKEEHRKTKEKVPNPPKPDAHKKQNSNSNHSNTSPKDASNPNTENQTPCRADKVKLTSINLFDNKPKKGSAHQAHRNTAPMEVAKGTDERIIPAVTSFARKLIKRHIGTQVIRKQRHKECQTPLCKKNATGTQTDPVKFDINQKVSSDPLERMKEIDMEIQMLLQEKFKLYNSMETNSKKTAASGSSMGLGMAVLNVPVEPDENDKDVDLLADTIAEEFTNLPVDELEQIALESVEMSSSSGSTGDKKGRRQKVIAQSRKKSASPTTRKKAKPPNISLIEQIISDDRPIEEIISLDDLETTPVRSKKKSSSKKKPKKPKTLVLDINQYDLKECSVVLNRMDVERYLKSKDSLKIVINLKNKTIQDCSQHIEKKNTIEPEAPDEIPETSTPHIDETSSTEPIVEETVNDVQIDMMEVCEDIVIGDESKTPEVSDEREVINEEIILDNSQSSAECSVPESEEGECKTYDYSTDELLKRDAVTVTGNADAVLAIECIDNSFIAACLDGNVYHFSADGQLLSTLRGSNLAVTCLTIVREKGGTTVYTGSLDSRIRYYDLDTGMEKGMECNVLSPIQTMDRAWDTVFVGTRTGFVLQFECKNNMLIPVSSVKFSDQSILALRAMKEGARKVLLVAARSDNVTIKDAQTGLLLRTLEGPKMTVYSLLFEDGKVYCGTSSHLIHVFDYASGTHVHAHEGGKGAVCLRATGGLVFAGCYDGCVYVYREGGSRPLAQLRGPALMLLSLAIHGTKIIAGYKDRSLYIWKIPLAVLQEMIL